LLLHCPALMIHSLRLLMLSFFVRCSLFGMG
jgi:hypothetical protein